MAKSRWTTIRLETKLLEQLQEKVFAGIKISSGKKIEFLLNFYSANKEDKKYVTGFDQGSKQ